MRSIASITIAGHVGRDPYCPISSNPSFVTFSVGVSSSFKNKEGTLEQKTDWYNCVTFKESLAAIIKQQVTKGSGVIIIGTPTLKSYIDKESKERFSAEIVIDKMSVINKESSGESQDIKDHFVSPSSRDDRDKFKYYSSGLSVPQKTPSYMDSEIDDNIPF